MLYAENFVFFFCFEYCFKICFQYGCSSSLNSNLKSNYLKTEQQRFRVLSAIEKCLFLTLYFEKKMTRSMYETIARRSCVKEFMKFLRVLSIHFIHGIGIQLTFNLQPVYEHFRKKKYFCRCTEQSFQ